MEPATPYLLAAVVTLQACSLAVQLWYGRRITRIERHVGLRLAPFLALLPSGVARAQERRPETMGQAVARAAQDAAGLSKEVAYLTRYLYLPNDEEQLLTDADLGLRYWINSLSAAPDLVPPRRVGLQLWAVLLADYGLSPEVWDRLSGFDPYFYLPVEVPTEYEMVTVKKVWPGGPDKTGKVYPKGYEYDAQERRPKPGATAKRFATAPWLPAKEAAALVERTQSPAPIVRLDLFITLTSRQLTLENRKTRVGYYDFLGVKDRDDFFKLHGLDVGLSKKLGIDTRAALLDSGVSQGGRLIKRFAGPTGATWITEDAFDKTGRGNPLENARDGDFKHNAEEIYAAKANGLFDFFAGDDRGNRQDTVPDGVGPDDSKLRVGRDARIHVIGCCRCHVEGLRPINDDMRRLVRPPVQQDVADLDEAILFRRRFFSNLERQRLDDVRKYAAAVEDCCGKGVTPQKVAEVMGTVYNRFAVERVTLARAAKECGVTAPQFQAALRRYSQPAAQGGLGQRLPTTLAAYIAEPPGELPRENFAEFFPVIMTALVSAVRP
jgi:hypothetical protein